MASVLPPARTTTSAGPRLPAMVSKQARPAPTRSGAAQGSTTEPAVGVAGDGRITAGLPFPAAAVAGSAAAGACPAGAGAALPSPGAGTAVAAGEEGVALAGLSESSSAASEPS